MFKKFELLDDYLYIMVSGKYKHVRFVFLSLFYRRPNIYLQTLWRCIWERELYALCVYDETEPEHTWPSFQMSDAPTTKSSHVCESFQLVTTAQLSP